MQTIETRIIPATNTKPTRIKATASGCGKMIIRSVGDFYGDAEVAKELMVALNWGGTMIGGHTKTGMVWVFTGEGAPTIINRVRK